MFAILNNPTGANYMITRILLLSLATSITLTGCTTYDAYTGDEKTTTTAKGAGIGAGAAVVLS